MNNFPDLINDFKETEACNFIKKTDSGTGVFLWIVRNF